MSSSSLLDRDALSVIRRVRGRALTRDIEHIHEAAHAPGVDVAEVVVGEQHAAQVRRARAARRAAVQAGRYGRRHGLGGPQAPLTSRLPLDALLAGHQLRRRR